MPSEPLSLTAAEMAVMMQHVLGPAAGDEAGLLADLGLKPEDLRQARASLLARGLLRPAPDQAAGQTFIDLEARKLLGAAVRPNALGILTVTQLGQPEHGVFFSWTPENFVVNTVDGRGLNRLQPLDPLDAAGEVVLSESGLANFTPDPGAPPPSNPEAAAREATLRGILMAVASARTAAEQVASLAWFVSAGQLWVLAPQAGGGDADLTALSVDELKASVQILIAQMIVRTREALAAAEA